MSVGGDRSPFEPGIRFENGKLHIVTPVEETTIDAWPRPMAWRRALSEPEQWHPCRPRLDAEILRTSVLQSEIGVQLVLPFTDLKRENEKDAAELDAYLGFFGAIPLGGRRAISRYQDRHFHLLQLAALCPGASDLIQGNPALAYALASVWAFVTPSVASSMPSVEKLVSGSQREALVWLGFPEAKSTRKIVRKIPAQSLTIPRLLSLRSMLRSPDVFRKLCHVSRINAGVIHIVTDPGLCKYASPRLLQEVAELQREEFDPHAACTIKDTLAKSRMTKRPINVFGSLQHLTWAHEIVMQDANNMEFEISGKFPPPPLPGTKAIVPLTETQQMLAEGQKMRHCVPHYVPHVLKGEVYVYRVLSPERATLCIKMHGDRWVIAELRGFDNSPVERTTILEVKRWLEQAQK